MPKIFIPDVHNGPQARRSLVGTCVDSSELSDPTYANFIKRNYHSLTCGNNMKWETIHPAAHTYNFTYGDAVAAFARANKMAMRGHCLTWWYQIPEWVRNITNAQDMRNALMYHIRTVGQHYKSAYAGVVNCWDINEVVDDAGNLLSPPASPNPFAQVLGWNYVYVAAAVASDYAVPVLNEIYPRGSYAPWQEKVTQLIRDGIFRRIGLQMHARLGQLTMTTLRQTLDAICNAGAAFEISEMDVRLELPITSDKLLQQARFIRQVKDVCLSYGDHFLGITMWGGCDGHSWIPSWYPGFGGATLFDEQLYPKPAYFEMVAGFS